MDYGRSKSRYSYSMALGDVSPRRVGAAGIPSHDLPSREAPFTLGIRWTMAPEIKSIPCRVNSGGRVTQ